MTAEILCVGTEILLGDIVNTNAAYLARELAACGITCYYQTVVGDNPNRLKQSLEHAFSRADMVITTGGLGPTYDDLTKETVAEHFGREMELHEQLLEHMKNVFCDIGRPMTENNRKQAYMPRGAVIFPNDRGTAPGLALEGKGKTVIMLPGPPREMTAMFENEVRPYLQRLSGSALVSRTIHFFGIGESTLEDELRAQMQQMTNPTIAPYAKEGEVQLRVTASAATPEEARKMTDPVVRMLRDRYPKYVYGVDVGTLQNALVQELAERGLTLATAESCTGGMIGKRITEIPGASRVYMGGGITYSNEMKTRMLGVKPETLEACGAVSEQTALEMARGIRKVSGADIGLSVTGVAGPDGGSEEKPVGLVYVAVCGEGKERVKALHLSRHYGGERELIRSMAASNALHIAILTARSFGE